MIRVAFQKRLTDKLALLIKLWLIHADKLELPRGAQWAGAAETSAVARQGLCAQALEPSLPVADSPWEEISLISHSLNAVILGSFSLLFGYTR